MAPGLAEAIARYGSEGEPPDVPLPCLCLKFLRPVHQSLCASDLGHVVVGEQALLAS